MLAAAGLAVRAPSAFRRVHLDPDEFYALFLQSHVKLSQLDGFPRDTRCYGGTLWLPLGCRQLSDPLSVEEDQAFFSKYRKKKLVANNCGWEREVKWLFNSME